MFLGSKATAKGVQPQVFMAFLFVRKSLLEKMLEKEMSCDCVIQ